MVHIVCTGLQRVQPTSCLSPNPLSTIFCTPDSSTHVKKPNGTALTPHGCATFSYDEPRHLLRAGSLAASVTITTSGTPDLNYFEIFTLHTCRSQWPRGLRRTSSASRQLRLWVRIPPGAWMFVCCECCVLSGRGLCDGLITRPGES